MADSCDHTICWAFCGKTYSVTSIIALYGILAMAGDVKLKRIQTETHSVRSAVSVLLIAWTQFSRLNHIRVCLSMLVKIYSFTRALTLVQR